RPTSSISVFLCNIILGLILLCHLGAFVIAVVSTFFLRYFSRRQDGPWGRLVVDDILPAGFWMLMKHTDGVKMDFPSVAMKLVGFFYTFDIGDMSIAVFNCIIYSALIAAAMAAKVLIFKGEYKRIVLSLAVICVLAPFSFQMSYFVDWRLIWFTNL